MGGGGWGFSAATPRPVESEPEVPPLFNVPECGDTKVKITACADHTRHCTRCGTPDANHFVGGSRPDARVICNPVDRASYQTLMRDTASPGRRFREGPASGNE